MITSDDEFFLDFEAEEKGTHVSVFRVEDTISETSTLTASENDSNGYISPTPPLFCKLRKARVLIKKLPRSVLAKYNLNCKESSTSTLAPVRASKRVGEKRTPGQYLSLHINKSITEIANKKKRLANTYLKQKLGKQQKLFQKQKIELPHAGHSKRSTVHGKTYPTNSKQKSYDKIKLSNQINVNNIERAQVGNSNKEDSSNRRSLHERIACTRLINTDWCVNNSKLSAASNFSNVDIKKYNISQNNFIGNSCNPTLPLSNSTNNYVAPYSITSDKTAPKLLQKNNNQVPFPLGTIISNNTRLQNDQASKPVAPTTDNSRNISDLLIFNKAVSTSNIGLQQPNNFTQTSTTKAFRVLHHLSSNNESVVNTPKLLIINQPPLVNDPLNIAKYSSLNNRNGPETSQVSKNISIDTESETDLELTDVENVVEPEVIKRIIYHTKSVQTKFTCNSSICGLVDSEEFSLNCFYCYDIFPLHKWYEFKEHIKREHHLEEKKNKSDSNEYIDKSSLKKSTINKEIAVINPTKAKEQIFKKLPLDPKLVAERTNGSKQDKISSTKNIKPYFRKNANQFKQLSKSKIQRSNVNSSSNIVNEVINLDSDDDVHEKEADCSKISKRATTANKYLNISNCIQQNSSASEFILPTLPHITVKRIANLQSKAPTKVKFVEFQKPLSTMGSPCLKNLVNKLPSNLNVQRGKTVPKPTTQQLLVGESKKPRYFIVKKIINQPPIEKMDNQNIPKSMTDTAISNPIKSNSIKIKSNSIKMSVPERLHTTKMLSPEKRDTTKMSIPEKLHTSKKLFPETSDDTRMGNDEKSDDDMPSSDEVEDSVPKPTNGRGILFGVTNSMVVIEFLLKLKAFPELWRSQLKNNTSNNYSHSIREMCCHLNNRFDLKIVDSEMRQSIRRVRNWYSRMLKNIYEHNINLNNTAPYKHKFPLYFRILNQFLTSDVDYSHNISLSTFKSEEIRPKLNISDHFKVPLPAKITSVTTCATSKTKANNTSNTDVSVESLIQFDADTLYEKRVLKEFDDTNTDESKKKRREDCIVNFECDVCHKTYKRIYELRRHKTLHFPPQFQCGVCSQKFYFKHWAEKCSHLKKKYRTAVKTSEQGNSTETLKQKRVWPKKIFRFKMICEICGASYRSIGSLNTHKRDKHLNQRAKCVVCNFTALSKWRVVQHQKKRHIVEPGKVEDVAKKTRPRTDTKTPFSNEAKQEFLWRREMRKKLKPGEIFYGCCKCRIVFNSRKEKVFHNKLEHPIKETTVVCLLCLPNKLLLSNSNSARRHYTDIHKVPWHEIDALVKRTKPIFSFLNKEEVEILKASENYKELLDEFLKDKNLQSADNIELLKDETLDAVHNLPLTDIDGSDEKENKTSEECTQGENVHVDCIIDHDYNSQELFVIEQSVHSNEHNYSEELSATKIYDNDAVNSENKNDFYSDTYDDGIIQLDYYTEESDNKIYNSERNDQEYLQSMVDDFIVEELVEESIVSEEFIDEIIEEDEDFFS